MNRVLVTGATGFIGRNTLAPLAARGFDIHAVTSRKPSSEFADAVEWHRADLLDPDGAAAAVEATQPTHLLHLAWYSEHGAFWGSAENLRWVEASLRLLRAFADAGGQRAVVAGTSAEYDWSHRRLIEDETPLAPATLYGAAKQALATVATAFASRAQFELAWGRVFFLYGPGEDSRRLVSSVARALVKGETAQCSDGHQVRDFLHVQDVAEAFVALLDSAASGAVNIASGEPVAVREVVTMLGELAGRPDLVALGALPPRPGDPGELVADTQKLIGEVRWRPRRSLETGLRDTLDWWRASCSDRR